jgi:hypothetical protein
MILPSSLENSHHLFAFLGQFGGLRIQGACFTRTFFSMRAGRCFLPHVHACSDARQHAAMMVALFPPSMNLQAMAVVLM